MRTTMRLVLGLSLALGAPCPTSHAQSLRDVFDQTLQRVLTLPLPRALDPFITLAQNADTVAIASLEIFAGQRHKEILLQQLRTNDPHVEADLERQLRAIQRMKSTLAGIKSERAAEERRAEEDGWDPFAGRLMATSPLAIPGVNTFVLLNDGLGDLAGDDPVGPAVSLVTPVFAGSEPVTTALVDASIIIEFVPSTATSGTYDLDVLDFRAEFAAYDIAPGTSTGPNRAALNAQGSPARGTYDPRSGEFELQLEGVVTNAYYPAVRPILWFANIVGGLNPWTGVAHVICDDPMIAPLPPTRVPMGRPKLMGAHRLAFDAASNTLQLLENTTDAPGADVAMIRRNDGNYLFDRASDLVLGAQVFVAPMTYVGEIEPGVHRFADVPLRIVGGGSVLASGALIEPTLNANAGSFFARWDLVGVSGRSSVLRELSAQSEPLLFQIAVGPSAYDLLIVTNDFTSSGRLEIPENFHLGVPPCRGLVETGGIGCPDRSTVLRMTFSGSPDIGGTAILGTSFDPTNVGPQFLTLGLSSTNWMGVPLPLPLDPLGAPGCFVNAEPGMVFPVGNPGGGGSLALPIPPDPGLSGLELHFQGLVIDPLANPLGLATSNRMTVTPK